MSTTPGFGPSNESDEWPDDEEATTPTEQRKIYLDRSKSGYTKIRHVFINEFDGSTRGSKPGMLGAFGRNHRAAILYLAVLSNWPWLSRKATPLPSGAWIRFLTCDGGGAITWTEQSLSHAWKTLESLGLVTRPRMGRLLNIQPRREDGKAAYTAPTGANGDTYWVLPHEFWTDQLHGKLSWPALAILLVLLKETNGRPTAELSIDRAQTFYGIGRTTAEKGLSELREQHFLLESRTRFIRDPDTGEGRRQTSFHQLMSPFSTKHRQELRDAASKRMTSRAEGEPETRDPGMQSL